MQIEGAEDDSEGEDLEEREMGDDEGEYGSEMMEEVSMSSEGEELAEDDFRGSKGKAKAKGKKKEKPGSGFASYEEFAHLLEDGLDEP
mmetsp:Transcript_18075/g.25057  ORF Transcript_18075/g.25057 Transcript_18075/m.25057 type:complete len:88 (+) Transcript_18075:226-489(+)